MISEKQVDNIRVHHQIIFLKHPLVSGPKPDDSMPGEAANFFFFFFKEKWTHFATMVFRMFAFMLKQA